jgi:hypothetical protein
MASTYLTYTQQSPSTAEGQKFTLSMWVKKSVNGTTSGLYGNTYDNTHRGYIYFNAQDTLQYYDSAGVNYTTTRIFRDNNAFYHIVIAVDTTLSSSSDRIKFYVNGVRETSFSASSAPNQNDTLKLMNTTLTPNMGRIVEAGTSYYFSGVISHVHFTQGYTYDATPFGETDSTTGEWKIKTSVTGVTYGTNGFFILKDGNSVTDQSGNGNNFTVAGGTLTDTLDCPDNVFATLNALVYSSASKTYGHGNNSITASDSGNWCSTQSTIGASSGKYYCEIKINSVGSYQAIGVAYQPNVSNTTSTQLIGELTGSAGWRNNGALVHGGSNINTYTTGDILMIAMDLDNQKLYFGKNGTWENSGVPTSGSTGTGSLKDLTANEFYHFVICPRGGSNYCNFGNGYFGTTAVSSAGTNASGNGIFEYDVPTGYTALSTKGLNL